MVLVVSCLSRSLTPVTVRGLGKHPIWEGEVASEHQKLETETSHASYALAKMVNVDVKIHDSAYKPFRFRFQNSAEPSNFLQSIPS